MSGYDAIHDIATAQTTENTKLREQLNQLQQENAELRAYIETAKKLIAKSAGAIEYLQDGFPSNESADSIKRQCDSFCKQAPQQSLTDIQAKADPAPSMERDNNSHEKRRQT